MAKRSTLWALVAVLTGLLVPVPAEAEYPEKPIQLVVTWPAGGRTDNLARAWAEIASKYFGRPVAVVNKPGGGGAKGTIDVQRAVPDGYTLMMTTIGNQLLRPLTARVPYTYKDFASIGQISAATMSIFTSPSQPYRDLSGLVEHARHHPGKVTYAAVKGTLPMLATELLAQKAGVTFQHVPYAGDAKAVPAALGGHVGFAAASSVSTILSHVKAGTGLALAAFSSDPDPALPRVPTLKSLGYDIVAEPWTGVVAPKDTSEPVLARIRDVFQKTLDDPEFQRIMEKIGEAIVPLDHERFRARWDVDHDAMAPIVEGLGLSPK